MATAEEVSTQLEKFSLSHFGDINVKTSKDSNNCFVTGMVIIPQSYLMIADNCNSSVKVLDIKKEEVIDQVRLVTAPWDITIISSEKVAVTMPDTSEIQLISVTDGKLAPLKKFSVDEKCRGICHMNDNLILTFPDCRELQFVDLDGKRMKSVRCDGLDAGNFREPFYVTSNDSCIYVSDKEGTVIRLNGGGEVTGSYGDFSQPRTLVKYYDDFILVSEYENGNIKVIDSDLSDHFELLQNLDRPWAICWCKETKKLYISFAKNNANFDNLVKIYCNKDDIGR